MTQTLVSTTIPEPISELKLTSIYSPLKILNKLNDVYMHYITNNKNDRLINIFCPCKQLSTETFSGYIININNNPHDSPQSYITSITRFPSICYINPLRVDISLSSISIYIHEYFPKELLSAYLYLYINFSTEISLK